MAEENVTDSVRLDGWAQIAHHLRVSPRTAQNYRESDGLPVHYNGTRVYASAAELDEWLATRDVKQKERRPEPDPPPSPAVLPPVSWFRRNIRLLIAAAVLLAAVAVTASFMRRSGNTPHTALHRPDPPLHPRYFWRAASEKRSASRVALPDTPSFATIAPDGRHLYIGGMNAKQLMVLDTTAQKVETVSIPRDFGWVAVSPDSSTIYIASIVDGLVILDAATRSVREVIPTNGGVRHLALSPDGRFAYLAMMHRGVWQLDLRTRSWRKLSTEGCPHFSALDRSGKRLVISYQCGGPTGRERHDAVEVIDIESGRRLNLFSGLPLVGGLHQFFPDDDRIWFEDWDSCLIKRYDNAGCPAFGVKLGYVYRTSDSKLLHTALIPKSAAGTPAFVPGANQVVFGAADAWVYDTERHIPIETLSGVDFHAPQISAFGDRAYLLQSAPPGVAILEREPAACTDLPWGLIEYLSMDGTPHDSIGSLSIGPSTVIEYAPGLVGQAMRLRQGATAELRSAGTVQFGQMESTMAFWIKPTTGAATLIEAEYNGSGVSLELTADSHVRLTLRPAQGDAVTLISATVVAPDEWHYLAITNSRTDLAVYVDGTRSAAHHSRGSALLMQHNHPTPYRVGPYSGLFDEVAVWGRALTEAEVRQVYGRRTSGECRP
ncbi:MAG: hypothetical protein IT168_07300 [Bryobacterales bacterium]|nr:hypothetical protein [Bryobacterales bacterium]